MDDDRMKVRLDLLTLLAGRSCHRPLPQFSPPASNSSPSLSAFTIGFCPERELEFSFDPDIQTGFADEISEVSTSVQNRMFDLRWQTRMKINRDQAHGVFTKCLFSIEEHLSDTRLFPIPTSDPTRWTDRISATLPFHSVPTIGRRSDSPSPT
jgi:hypothetical protein